MKFRDPVKVNQQSIADSDIVLQGMDDDSQEAQVQGKAADYTQSFTVWHMPGFRYMRKQEPGSYQRTLSQNPKVMFRLNHQEAFANTKAGTLQLMEREGGLHYEATVSKANPQALAMLVELQRGTLTESSVAYQITKAVYEEEELEDGTIVRTQIVQEANLSRGDVSVVQFGMNPNTTAGLLQAQSLAADPETREAVEQVLTTGTYTPIVTTEELFQPNQAELELLELQLQLAADLAELR